MLFDVFPLFTQVHIEEEIVLNQQALPMDPFVFFDGKYYEQTEGNAMGSQLSPVVSTYLRKILKIKLFHH